MTREDFVVGDRVIHKTTYMTGIVVEDAWAVCLDEEVPVRFDEGEGGYEGMHFALLEHHADLRLN